MQPVNVTLREAVRIFCVRIGQKPVTYRFKEIRGDFSRHANVTGAELVFSGLTRQTIKAAMFGLNLKDTVKGDRKTAWSEQVRWTYEGPKIKFQVTLRLYKNNTQSFNFTTVW